MNTLNYLACSTCRVSFEGTGDSIGYSIFFLLFVILAVLGAIGFFMVRLARRENDNLDPELRDDYVPH
jgi:heme/copper-type cytochrome/quinol oxidase subunit 2